MTKARFAASKAADSHQAPTQPRETEAGVLTAWQQMLKGSESSRDRMLLSAVVELSVRPPGCDCISLLCSHSLATHQIAFLLLLETRYCDRIRRWRPLPPLPGGLFDKANVKYCWTWHVFTSFNTSSVQFSFISSSLFLKSIFKKITVRLMFDKFVSLWRPKRI